MKMVQFGFFFDESRCYGCHACAVSCKSWNLIPPGPTKWLRLFNWEKGAFPNVRLRFLFAPCYHCEKTVCIDSCPEGAIYKEEKYGAVLVDSEKCTGCRLCWVACPYGAPQFESETPGTKMSKCTMCVDRLEQGLMPNCVMACPMRALDFGPLEKLMKKYGDLRELEEMPSAKITKPAIIFKPQRDKKQVVPYDADKALDLLRERGSMHSIFSTKTDVTEIPKGLIGRTRLVLKPKNLEELMRLTRDDQG